MDGPDGQRQRSHARSPVLSVAIRASPIGQTRRRIGTRRVRCGHRAPVRGQPDRPTIPLAVRPGTLRVKRGWRHHPRATGLRQAVGIRGLVVVDRARQRHQDGGAPRDRRFRHGRRTCPRDHQMRRHQASRHIGEKRRQLGRDTARCIRSLSPAPDSLWTCLLHDRDPRPQRFRRKRCSASGTTSLNTRAPSDPPRTGEPDPVDRGDIARLRECGVIAGLTGIACDLGPDARRNTLASSRTRTPEGPLAAPEPVRSAEHRILFMQDSPPADAGPTWLRGLALTRIAAKADNTARPELRQYSASLDNAGRPSIRSLSRRATHRGRQYRHRAARIARVPNTALDDPARPRIGRRAPARCRGPRSAASASARKKMPAGSASGDDDRAHGRCSTSTTASCWCSDDRCTVRGQSAGYFRDAAQYVLAVRAFPAAVCGAARKRLDPISGRRCPGSTKILARLGACCRLWPLSECSASPRGQVGSTCAGGRAPA